jgi:glutamyl-tRNA(Gln) amidotransferase subunit E
MDYDELGFKCGIEIHQQLATETKLFCDCPVDLEDENASERVSRYLRAVAGETGETDEAAEVESRKSRQFIYKYYERNNCLVEIDEEPPHEMDREALDTALTFARMVNAEVPDEIQVMRKMVVDGSNTSGFQRTAMVGLDGKLEVDKGAVTIEDIELEEESSGIHEKDENKAVYDLNRLGVPLIEIGTDASIKNPEHAEQVAKKLGMLLRSTGKARRGIGTIRQDVNVSIDGGARVEIKGFQDVDNLERLISNEVERQKNLIELGEELDEAEIDLQNVTEIFEGTDNQIVSTVLENNGQVYALKLPQLTGKMKRRISGERYLAKELVDYARSMGVNGILHTDEDIENYQLVEEFEEVSEELGKEDEDVIAVIAAEAEQAENAAEAVKERARDIYTGTVPEETRDAEQDFTTSYMRPLPGSARMYPETDIPPITVTDDEIEEIDANLPRTLDERFEDYREEIGEELASQIVYSEELGLFERFRDRTDSKLVANLFTNILPRLESEGVEVSRIPEESFGELLDAYESGEISKGDIEDVVREAVEMSMEEAVQEVLENQESDEELREIVREVLDQNEDMIQEQGRHAQGALMGQVMGRVEASGDKVSEILGEELEERL